MMIRAVLGNPNHPEYGVATIPFPIPRDQYAHCVELLEALEIGDAVKADCKVERIDSFYTVLKRTEMLTVNVEELNYLAKRLDSFDTGEAAQFQAMAHKLELFELKDLINLTFCCQQATVITDFSDLAAIGRNHYMNLHGGSASVDELNALDGKGTARQLIESGSGTITPYGVVYDNGMKLEQVYDGRFFPCYYYEPNAITVAVTAKSEPEDTEHITWLFLPMVQEEIDRALLRGGITDPSEIRLSLEDSWLPHEVFDLLDLDHVDISELNALVQALDEFSDMSIRKYAAAAVMARPHTTEQAKHLAENLDLFDFAPSASTPEEYGKYMIQQSGRFEYDENLDAFYDYEKYGTERMNEEDGMFTDRGYIAYKGYISMEEVMNGSQSSHMENGRDDVIIQAELRRKQSEYEGEACSVDKVIELPAQRFKQFSRALLADYDFIAENKNAIRHDDDARHCLLILDAEGKDGFLVDPQGYNYARYSAFVPNARSLLTPDMGIDRSYLSQAEPWRDESRDEMLRMTLRVEGKPDYTLILPADEEYLDAVKNYLDIDVFADAMLCDIHFKVPYIGELIRDTDCPAVEDYNDFAEALEDIWQQDGALLTYAAVLEAEKPETLHRACELLQDLDNYQRITEGAYGYGQQRLQETLGLDDEAIYELEGYMDFEKYGQDCMENDCVTKTEFGLLRRLDPPFPEQTQGQQMFR